MRRTAIVALLLLSTAGLAGCSEAGVPASDAYKIGCPAVDAAAAGGSVANKAAVSGLKALRDSKQLDPEPQKWVETAIDVLGSDNPNAASDSAKKLIIDGCKANGYPLTNLK